MGSGSRSPRTRKGGAKGKSKSKENKGKEGKTGIPAEAVASPFAPLTKELPAWPSLEGMNTNLQTAPSMPSSAALARDQEAVKLIKQAYPDPALMPQDSKEFIERVEKDTAKTVTKSLHSTTSAMDKAHKTLSEATEAKKAHRHRWATHVSEAIKVWESQLHNYRQQQAAFQEVISKARSDIETYRSTIQGLTARTSSPFPSTSPAPMVEVEDLTGDWEAEEEKLQKEMQGVLRSCFEALGVQTATVQEIPEDQESMEAADKSTEKAAKRPRSLEPFSGHASARDQK
eukprot:s1574_g9.t1